MMSPYQDEHNTQELLRLALRELVSGASLKDRLRQASVFVLQMDGHDWPLHLQTEIADIRRVLQAERALRGETALIATIRKLSLNDAEQIAKRMIDLSFALMEAVPVHFEGSGTHRVSESTSSAEEHENNIIPLFAEL
jgi:hypothetical protein